MAASYWQRFPSCARARTLVSSLFSPRPVAQHVFGEPVCWDTETVEAFDDGPGRAAGPRAPSGRDRLAAYAEPGFDDV